MKKIEFQAIGDYELISKNEKASKLIKVTIKRELKNALLKLGYFSHCVLFTREDSEIYSYVLKIIEIKERIGEMFLEADEKLKAIKGDLIDIKPYFPCEEIAEGYKKENRQENEVFTSFLLKEIQLDNICL
ncbi:hypothetical protein [Desulfosporosinus nitroreducens]|uniref:Uncharacterized protein n=1 Tax=Desulfosporosinus nitroreducens TaxID=2018668 RepID=A0ABT8QP48_9FIRM|nr:hypothetical protein [Desulfosporosinus nitroreducens]MDO0823122.1 hypothetical protein [Desulfosporosinus nitroreducens]